jgi:hypothetical protein
MVPQIPLGEQLARYKARKEGLRETIFPQVGLILLKLLSDPVDLS